MTGATRPARLRVLGAGTAALLLGSGLVLALSVAAGAPRAAADSSGAVYGGSVGGLGVLTLSGVRTGGATPLSVSGLPAGVAVNAVAINSSGTLAVASLVDPSGAFVGVDTIDVPQQKVTGSIKVSFAPVGFAMDPNDPDVAWTVEDSFGDPQIATVQKLDLASHTSTTWVGELPTDLGGTPVTASSLAVAPDGKTLYVAWGSLNTNNVGYFGVDAVTLVSGKKPTITRWSGGLTGALGSATPTQTKSPNGSAVYLMATDLAVAPDGNHLFVTSVANETTVGSPAGFTGSVFNLDLPLKTTETPTWTLPFVPSQSALSEPLAVKVSPDDSTVYVGGVSYPGSDNTATNSFVVGLDAVTHATKASTTIPVTPKFSPSGVSALALSPNGQTLLVEALDPSHKQSVLYPLAAPGLTSTGSPTVLASATPGNDSTSVYGPLDIAIGRAQNPPTPTTTPTTSTSSTSTPTTPAPTTPTTIPGTTPSTLHGQPVPGPPTLLLNPAVGPPGTIVTVTGHGFRPNTPVTVSWTVSTGSAVITADAHGDLPPAQLLILTPDVLGPRFAQASSSPPATAPFLVVPSTSEPGGDDGGLMFRNEGP